MVTGGSASGHHCALLPSGEQQEISWIGGQVGAERLKGLWLPKQCKKVGKYWGAMHFASCTKGCCGLGA